ncbi:hypothetical protein [Lysinibacillus fusiformis]|uniref:Uncharacterized protein n=1 Tax=Lysinibacillus fusiformis TaxID=28031 RepID=A0A1H9HDK3_9BACI|nr:hypothetical protein [Lysinibacillus fusiformis]SCY30803.1 hypothetical protein SAMN02787081_01982 [Lysinibacillus fusiformis]SEN52565.1 hypothetical protein SAMN02787103_02039 [Lysinibacillus fusiformis]SEQ60382.1 hypothetical protein SAMN02787113_01995 [Lysinibacillus fusiformis]
MDISLRQLSLFDDFSQSSRAFFRVHETVKVKEVKDNPEIYEYRKYYFSHVIGKKGVVQKVDGQSVLVGIGDESIIFDAQELEWVA